MSQIKKESWKSLRRLLANRAFFLFLIASVLNLGGEGIFFLALLVIVQKATGSSLAISYMLLLTMIPPVLVSPFLGRWLDRRNKAITTAFLTGVRVVCLLLLAAMLITGLDRMPAIYALVFLSYLVWYCTLPAAESLLREVLREEQYLQGVSLTQIAWQIGLFSAAAVAGVVMEYFGVALSLVLGSAIYLLSFSLFLRICVIQTNLSKSVSPLSPPQKSTLTGYCQEIFEGCQNLFKKQKLLYFSLASAMVFPFFQSMNTLLAPFNYQLLGGNESSLGVIESAAGLGSLFSALACIQLSNQRCFRYLAVSCLLLVIGTVSFSISSIVPVAFFCYMVMGFAIGNVKVLSRTLLFEQVDSAHVGKTMAVSWMLSLIVGSLFALTFGWLGEKSLVLAYVTLASSALLPLIFATFGIRSARE